MFCSKYSCINFGEFVSTHMHTGGHPPTRNTLTHKHVQTQTHTHTQAHAHTCMRPPAGTAGLAGRLLAWARGAATQKHFLPFLRYNGQEIKLGSAREETKPRPTSLNFCSLLLVSVTKMFHYHVHWLGFLMLRISVFTCICCDVGTFYTHLTLDTCISILMHLWAQYLRNK